MPKSPGRGKRNTRRRLIAEVEAQTGPCRAVVVHRYADGWTMRRLTGDGDELREGNLMHHCLMRDARLWPDGVGLYSLRDLDNFPHVTLLHAVPGVAGFSTAAGRGWVGFITGRGDRRPIKPAYRQRILSWLAALPYGVTFGVPRMDDGWEPLPYRRGHSLGRLLALGLHGADDGLLDEIAASPVIAEDVRDLLLAEGGLRDRYAAAGRDPDFWDGLRAGVCEWLSEQTRAAA